MCFAVSVSGFPNASNHGQILRSQPDPSPTTPAKVGLKWSWHVILTCLNTNTCWTIWVRFKSFSNLYGSWTSSFVGSSTTLKDYQAMTIIIDNESHELQFTVLRQMWISSIQQQSDGRHWCSIGKTCNSCWKRESACVIAALDSCTDLSNHKTKDSKRWPEADASMKFRLVISSRLRMSLKTFQNRVKPVPRLWDKVFEQLRA